MLETESIDKQPVFLKVADPAAEYILRLLEREKKERGALRIRVEGGGCSGFSYHFEVIGETEPRDTVVEHQGARVAIDPESAVYLKGAYLMFTKTLMKSGFKIFNPQATAECSCGESFAVDTQSISNAPIAPLVQKCT